MKKRSVTKKPPIGKPAKSIRLHKRPARPSAMSEPALVQMLGFADRDSFLKMNAASD